MAGLTTLFYSIAACVGLDMDHHHARCGVVNQQLKTTEWSTSLCYALWDATSFSVISQ